MKQNHATGAKRSMEKGSTAGFRVADAGYGGIAIVARYAGEAVQPEVVKVVMKKARTTEELR